MSAPVFSPASPVPVPQFIADRWYPTGPVATSTGAALATGLVRLYAFQLRARIKISTLMARVVTVGLGSFQLAIYAHDATTGRPTGAVLARTGDMSSTVAAAVTGDITGADVVLEAGVYWAATNVDATSAVTVFQTLNQNNAESTALFGALLPDTASLNGACALVTLTTPMAYDTWSTMTGATFTEGAGPPGAAFVWVKAA
jgi:hypothetical protein